MCLLGLFLRFRLEDDVDDLLLLLCSPEVPVFVTVVLVFVLDIVLPLLSSESASISRISLSF